MAVGTKQLSAYHDEVKEALGLSATDPVVTDATLTRMLNQSAKYIATIRDWPWLYDESTINTVAGTGTVAVPSGATTINFLRGASSSDKNSWELKPKQARDALDVKELDGPPLFYYVNEPDAVIVLTPTPDTVYNLTCGFTKVELEASSDSDTYLLPDEYSPWLVAEAAMRMAVRTNNVERLASLRNAAAEWRAEILDNVRRHSGPTKIRRTRASHWQDR